MFLVYSLLFSLAALLMAPYYAWRYRGTSLLRKSWRERLGFLPQAFQQSQRGAIWLHAVSVGETLAVSGLVQEIQRRYPERKIFISHITPSGREAGEKRLPHLAGRFYLPLDWDSAVRRVLARLRPKLLLIVETELWPNLLRAAHRSGAQVVLINARLSDRSFRGYRRFRPFMGRVLENVDWIFAQTSADAGRFRRIGARPDRVVAMGNLKFDGAPPPSREFSMLLKTSLAAIPRAPVVVAGSTMPGEEQLSLKAWDEIRKIYPQGLLILAPRHPPRFGQVAQLLSAQGYEFVRRTALAPNATELNRRLASPGILLLDTLGELAGVFELADVVLVGGSLVPAGGHNPLEPAWWSKPIVFGPHMENFRDAAEILLESQAAIQAPNSEELAHVILALLADGARRRAMGAAARRTIERESGATQRILDRLPELLHEDEPVPQSRSEDKGR